tara:strand:+ start:1211 stop:1975 length:765 start_codon:yes stop_codon:yes gene_type:complete
MKLPSLPLFTDTFTAETVHLSNQEVGIYIRLLCFAWTKNSKPFTTSSAYRICQCRSDECEKIVDMILEEFFKIADGNIKDSWTHKRLTEERDYLTDYYQKKSNAGRKGAIAKKNFANGKTEPYIPIPIPIPIKFNTFWEALKIKRGSKKVAQVRFAKECKDLDPLKLANIYNNYASKIPDKQFIQHISTWITQRRFEDEDLESIDTGPTLKERMEKLGYKHRGSEGNYEQFIKDGKNYRIHKFEKEAKIELEEK